MNTTSPITIPSVYGEPSRIPINPPTMNPITTLTPSWNGSRRSTGAS